MMRLLQVDENGEFSLTDDLINNIPPYAILSHTWGEDHEEVDFKDLTIGPRKIKAGYKKLRFCAEQALHDGLQYFWVDTCCIDKSNSTELSEAINSMFRWYRNAAKCYVYLSDVSTNNQSWEQAFRISRWFTRGWTLQELIAPPSVEFFCSEGKQLGDKRSLEPQLHEITGIAVQALRGTSLSEFRVNERMLWAKTRQTKREEDKAYSLLGIFGIHMPLIYGEGAKSAFRRLQEEIDKNLRPVQIHNPLDRLPYAAEAPFNSYTKQYEPICLPDTRVDLLQEICDWADRQDGRCIFWLNGLAGTGKSTIARTIARNYFDKKRLGASFFFSRGGGDVSHAGKFVSSIAVQLTSSIPALRQYICDAITECSDISSRSLRDQWHELVLHPLSKLDSKGCLSSYILVVDALDECDDDNNIQVILQLLAEARSLERVRLQVFLTSRPEIPIRYGFCQIPDVEHQDFVLHRISPSIIDHDIYIFLEYNLRLIGQERFLDASWLGEKFIKQLVRNASGLFIWAATACRFIRAGLFAEERLRMLINGSTSSTTPEEHLNEMYITVLKNCVLPSYMAQEREILYGMLRHLLGSIVALFSPLSASSLSRLLNITKQKTEQTLKDLHAILDIPKDESHPLRLHHPSFRDFLLDKGRCGDSNFWVDEKQAHQTMADSCIGRMSTSLKQDICDLNIPGILVTDVENSRVEQYLPPEIQYACLYWVQHLQKSDTRLHDNHRVHQFLQEHLLHWLEALSWMRKVSKGIHAITSLQSMALSNDSPGLLNFVHDTKRFALYNRLAIEQAPLQTYCSALVFAPSMSVVRKRFRNCIPRWIRKLPKVENNWNALLQTLEGHSSSVNAVAFSPDGKLLASASGDETVKLWDTGSGAHLQTLEGHSSSVNAVAFSPDSKLLASASGDKTVKLWDASSGAHLQTLEAHLSSVNAVAFSPDSKLLASASNNAVKQWDASSGAHLQTFGNYPSHVIAVAFSPDSKLLTSVSSDRTIKLWDASSGTHLQTLEGHSLSVNAMAFSPDGKLLALASYDSTVKLWDTSSGAHLQTLKGHSWFVNAVAFSLDGKLLALASGDKTVKLWDTGLGVHLQTLKGHSLSVNAVAFSPDSKLLASASSDSTVKLWDASSGAHLQTLEDHSSSVNAMAFSPDGKLLASASGDKLLASASGDKTVKLWDAGSGAHLQTLKGHSSPVNAVAFSPDGRLLASASSDRTVRLWNASSGAHLQTLGHYPSHVIAVAFSPDGKLLASASGYKPIKLWDASSGAHLQTIVQYSSFVNAVAFSPDSKLLASASNSTVKLWDVGSGAHLQTLGQYPSHVNAVAFSPDGKLLASASGDKTVRLWDTGSGAPPQTLTANAVIQTLSFSNDRTFLHTNRGLLPITFLSNSTAISRLNFPPPPSAVFITEQWVSRGTEKVLWLPSEHRPSSVAVYGAVVGFGYPSGQVSFMEFIF